MADENRTQLTDDRNQTADPVVQDGNGVDPPSDPPPPYTSGSFNRLRAQCMVPGPGPTVPPVPNVPPPSYPGLPVGVTRPPRPAAVSVNEVGSSEGPAQSQWITSVMVCMFCFCWPISCFAIYYSIKASEANGRHDYPAAHRYNDSAKRLNLIAVTSGCMITTLLVAMLIFFGFPLSGMY